MISPRNPTFTLSGGVFGGRAGAAVARAGSAGPVPPAPAALGPAGGAAGAASRAGCAQPAPSQIPSASASPSANDTRRRAFTLPSTTMLTDRLRSYYLTGRTD